jgi:hypothetical protein
MEGEDRGRCVNTGAEMGWARGDRGEWWESRKGAAARTKGNGRCRVSEAAAAAAE